MTTKTEERQDPGSLAVIELLGAPREFSISMMIDCRQQVDIDPRELLALASSSSLAFLADPEEDIYTLEDGEVANIHG